MLPSKKTALKPILESEDGIHLTVYLVNRGHLIDLKSQLTAAINEAQDWIGSAMTNEERKRFLEPLSSLLIDTSIFQQINGHIGLFRNADSFRVLNIPINVEQGCHVASSFHVKPLLRWLQADKEFLFLGIGKESAQLYFGNQNIFTLVDAISFPDFFKDKRSYDGYLSLSDSKKRKVKDDETFAWLNVRIEELSRNSKPKLFLAGEKSRIQRLNNHLKYKNTFKSSLANSFDEKNIDKICSDIRRHLKDESQKDIEKALIEFTFAEAENRTRKNIFQIAKAVVQGKVRKLIVTDELSIFGKIDKKTGGLSIHPCDLDHEDDDILDDLAQMVLSQGGEVLIAKRNEIPNGRPILAILDDDGLALRKTEELLQKGQLYDSFKI